MNTVTHIAGPAMTVGNRTIQRCCLCGEKLIDDKNQMSPINPDGTIDKTPTWEPGRLIQTTVNTNPTQYILLPDTDKLPPDTCLDLIEN